MPPQQNGNVQAPARTVIVGAETLLGNCIARFFQEKGEKLVGWTSNLEQLGTHQKETFANRDIVVLVLGASEDRVKLAGAVIAAAAQAQVLGLILLSSLCADLADTSAGHDYYPLEDQARCSGLPLTIVRTAPFMENLWLQIPHVRNSNLIFYCVPKSTSMNWIALDDIALAVLCLTKTSQYTGQVYSLTAPEISFLDLAAAFPDVKGRPVKYHQQTPQEFRSSLASVGVQAWEINTLAEYAWLAEADSVVTKHTTAAFKEITGAEPQSVGDWVRHNFETTRSTSPPRTFFTSQEPPESNGPKVIVVLHAETLLGTAVATALSGLFLSGVTIRALATKPEGLEQLELYGVIVEPFDIKQLQLAPESSVFFPLAPEQPSEELQALVKVVAETKSNLVLASSILAGVQTSEFASHYRQVESVAKKVPHTVIRMPVILDEFLGNQVSTLRKDKIVIGPAGGDFAMAFISLEDAATACSHVLATPTPYLSKTFVMTADVTPLKDVCSTLRSEWAYDSLTYETRPDADCIAIARQSGASLAQASEMVACQKTQWVLAQDFASIMNRPATTLDLWAASVYPTFGSKHRGLLILQPNELLSQVVAATLRSDHPERPITVAGEVDDSFPVKTVTTVDLDWGNKFALVLQRSVVLLCTLEATDPLFLLTSLLNSIKSTGKISSLLVVVCAVSAEDHLFVEALTQSRIPFYLLKVPMLFESIWGHISSLQRDQIVYGSLDADHPIVAAAIADVATVTLDLLLNSGRMPEPPPKVLTLRKTSFTGAQLTSLLSTKFGRSFEFAQLSQHVWVHELARSVCGGNQEAAEKLTQHYEASGGLAFDNSCRDAFEVLELPPRIQFEQWLETNQEEMAATLATPPASPLPKLAINASGGILAQAIARALQGRWQVSLGTRELDALDVEAGLLQEKRAAEESAGVSTLILLVPDMGKKIQYVQRSVEYAIRAGMLSVVFISLITETAAKSVSLEADYQAMEERIQESGLRYTILRIPYCLMDLNWCHVLQVLDRAEFKGVPNPDAPLACLSTKDVAFAIVSLLSEPWKYANKVLMQPGSQYTALRLAESFGNALGGRHISYQQVDEEQYQKYIQGMDLTDKTAIATMGCYWPASPPDCEVLSLQDTTTVEQWVDSLPLADMSRDREDAKTERARLLVLIADTQEQVKQLKAKQREQERIYNGLLAQRAQQEAKMGAAEQRYVAAKVKQETIRIRARRQRDMDSSQMSRRSQLSTSSA